MIYCNACLAADKKTEAVKKIKIGNIEESFCADCYLDFLSKMNKELDEKIGGIPRYYCLRCGHSWPPRISKQPKKCPNCNSPYWNKPRKKKGK